MIKDDFLKGEKMKYENSIDCIGSISHQSINLQFNKIVSYYLLLITLTNNVKAGEPVGSKKNKVRPKYEIKFLT